MRYNLFLDDDRRVQVFALVDAGKTRAEAAEELGIEQELEPTLDQMIGFCLAALNTPGKLVGLCRQPP